MSTSSQGIPQYLVLAQVILCSEVAQYEIRKYQI